MVNDDIRWIILGFLSGTLGIMYLVNQEFVELALCVFLITLPKLFG